MFTPWRMTYIEGAREGGGSCVFCDIGEVEAPSEVLVLDRGETAFTVMNLYPYTTGHMLVVPARHIGAIELLDAAEVLESGQMIQRCVEVLQEEMHPDGFNIGMNLGGAAGAGVPGHVHWHVVPRWSGDSNFMPVTADTRLIPEDVEATYRRLAPYFAG